MTQEIRTYPRTTEEALLDVKYFARLHHLHTALYRRTRMLMAFISLLAGSFAFATTMNGLPTWTIPITGLLIATISIIDAVAAFPEKAMNHQTLYRRFTQLQANSSNMTLTEIDRAIAEIQMDHSGEIDALRLRAYNDNVLSAGRPDFISKVSLSTRILSLIV